RTKKIEGTRTTTYTYDGLGRMIRATIQDGADVAVEEHAYDWRGARVRTTRDGLVTRYLVDESGELSHVLSETDASGALQAYYTRGGDVLISMSRGNAKSWYLFDGHGSVRMLADASGQITDGWTYDAWGELTSRTGVTENAYLYAGERFDRTTELYQLRARYMDPKTGTFLSMDPWQGNRHDPITLHKYLYANADPVNNVDPTGMMPTLAGIMSALHVDAILHGGVVMKVSAVLGLLSAGAYGVQFAFAMKDLVVSVLAGDIEGMFHAMGNGLVSVMGIVGVCEFGMVTQILTRALAAYGAYESAQDLMKAIEEGDVLGMLSSGLSILLDLAVAFAPCFDGDTIVATEAGAKRIDEIQAGDRVWAYDVETGELALKDVLEVFVREHDELLHIETERGVIIDATTNHPFWVEGKGWTAAGDLAIGDAFHALSDGVGVVTGLTLEKLDAPVLVYNLDVAGFDTYFVGDGVLVHNACGSGNRHTPDQEALVDLAQDAQKRGVSRENAETLVKWAEEYGFKPLIHWEGHAGGTNAVTQGPHFRIGPVNHIPIK
ncbi:MAG: hypothetical protein IJR14_00240, partial [Synergistaceae bacterium]|nr:hypothetical protein [Synergistaceae bacterium]